MNKRLLLGGGAAALVVLVAAVWFLFFRDDAPDAVDLDAASAQLDADLGSTEDDAPTTTQAVAPPFDGDVNGEWVIDDEVGTFDFESASGSFAGFRVDEELTVGAVTAVGRTGDVSGSVTIVDGALTAATIEVRMDTIVSNDSRRERAILRVVGASEFPTATFVLTEPVELPAGLADGERVSVQAVGDLTVKGTTVPTTFEIAAVVRDDGFGVIVGSADIVFADFGVETPSAPIVVSVDDNGVVEFQLIVSKG